MPGQIRSGTQVVRILGEVPKGTSSKRFQEQSTTAMPLSAISSASCLETQLLPLGLRMMPGNVTPSLSSSIRPSLASREPVHFFLLQCPRSHIANLKCKDAQVLFICKMNSDWYGLTSFSAALRYPKLWGVAHCDHNGLRWKCKSHSVTSNTKLKNQECVQWQGFSIKAVSFASMRKMRSKHKDSDLVSILWFPLELPSSSSESEVEPDAASSSLL